jgi:hypothetical protein
VGKLAPDKMYFPELEPDVVAELESIFDVVAVGKHEVSKNIAEIESAVMRL